MQILYRYRYLKNNSWLLKLFDVIELLFDLGIDVDHVDKYNQNITDYLMHYKYFEVFSNKLKEKYNLPNATNDRIGLYTVYNHKNPSPYVSLLYKYRYAKSNNELTLFINDYKYLQKTIGPLTKKQLYDNGGNDNKNCIDADCDTHINSIDACVNNINAYPSLYDLCSRWNFDNVILFDPELDL